MKTKKRRSKKHRIPVSHCVVCGYKTDASTAISGKNTTPKPGDCSLCLKCGEVMIFAEDLVLRQANVADLMKFNLEQQCEIGRAQAMIRKLRLIK